MQELRDLFWTVVGVPLIIVLLLWNMLRARLGWFWYGPSMAIEHRLIVHRGKNRLGNIDRKEDGTWYFHAEPDAVISGADQARIAHKVDQLNQEAKP